MTCFWSTLAMLVVTIQSGACIRCYACIPTESIYIEDSPTKNSLLCTAFRPNDTFAVDCPYSTMCVQKEMRLILGNGVPSVAIARHCAYQTENGHQVLINDKWYYDKPIHEIYSEGCSVDDSKGERLTRTEVCYCRGDLCNGGDFPPASVQRQRRLKLDFSLESGASANAISVLVMVSSVIFMIQRSTD